MSDVVLSERPAPHVRLVTLNRPDQLNAINDDLCEALREELDRQQILALHGGAPAEAITAYLEKRAATFPD